MPAAPRIYAQPIPFPHPPKASDPLRAVTAGCDDCYESKALYWCDGVECCARCARKRGFEPVDHGAPPTLEGES